MNKFNKQGIVAFVVILAGIAIASIPAGAATAAPPAAAPPAAKTVDASAVVDEGWSERCNEKDKKNCEVFTRLQMKSSSMRVAEVIISFPHDKSLPKGTARGVIIMPLGIMLESGVTLAIDKGTPFAFKSRFCIPAGCYSYVNLNKDILDSMKKGKELNVFFKTADNNDMHMTMGLDTFKKAISKIE